MGGFKKRKYKVPPGGFRGKKTKKKQNEKFEKLLNPDPMDFRIYIT
jgi:hypothetical protein